MDPENEFSRVLEANRRFYSALEGRGFAEMAECWSHSDEVACTHPGWHRLDGWEEVSRSWKAIFTNSRPWRVRCEAERALVEGAPAEGSLAIVFCIENLEAVGGQGDPARMQATNVYRREGGDWKMIHHHASPMPEVEEREEDDTVN